MFPPVGFSVQLGIMLMFPPVGFSVQLDGGGRG